MWWRRSSTSTRLSSWLATRSATVRPKKPEPTTTRSGRAEVTPRDCTGAAPPAPARAGVSGAFRDGPVPLVPPVTPAGPVPGLRGWGGRRLLQSPRAPLRCCSTTARGGGDVLAGGGARGVRDLPGARDDVT